MKKNVMLAALMLVSTLLFAQRKHHHDRKGHDRPTEFMKKELLLTDDQYAKVKSINENFMKQFSAIRKDTAMSQGKAHAQTKKLRDNHQAQLRSVLNDPQWAKWTELKHKGRDHKSPSRNNRPGRGQVKPEHEDRG